MHEGCLKLTLRVVQDHHKDAQFLVQGQRRVLSVDELTEVEEGKSHHNWTGVLNVEDRIPADLRA